MWVLQFTIVRQREEVRSYHLVPWHCYCYQSPLPILFSLPSQDIVYLRAQLKWSCKKEFLQILLWTHLVLMLLHVVLLHV